MVAAKAPGKSCLIFLFLLAMPFLCHPQSSLLSRKITLDKPDCSLEVAIREIGIAGRFRFSCDAGIISGDRQVRLKFHDKQVGQVLKDLLGTKVRFREIGDHLILLRNRSSQQESKPYADMAVLGIILDARNQSPIEEATIFEVQDRISAISSENGSYKLVMPTGKKTRSLTFCKSGYSDTVIFINQARECHINVQLHPLPEIIPRLDTRHGLVWLVNVDSLEIVHWLVPRVTSINAKNLEPGTIRTVQASLIPYIGTNWKVTGSVTNRFSLNLISGYTGGLKGFELGGLLNITRKDMSGFQICGVGNIVGERARGIQIGGLFNFDLGKFEGVQIAGLCNYVPDLIGGSQISWITNIAINKCQGSQVALFLNLAGKELKQAQVCGLVNYGRDVDGVQFAGLLNIAGNHNNGLQIAGFMNYAVTVNGLQVGMVNISTSVERGVPIGLFSYVKEGYHLFEVSGNEIFYGNVAFKSGTRSFYNFLQAGIGSGYKLQGSYGIGTIVTLKKKLSLNIDASAGFVYHPVDTIYHGLLLKLYPALEYRFTRHFAIFTGPAYNFFLFSKGKPSATPRGLSSYDFYFRSTARASIQMWLGGVLGVRF